MTASLSTVTPETKASIHSPVKPPPPPAPNIPNMSTTKIPSLPPRPDLIPPEPPDGPDPHSAVTNFRPTALDTTQKKKTCLQVTIGMKDDRAMLGKSIKSCDLIHSFIPPPQEAPPNNYGKCKQIKATLTDYYNQTEKLYLSETHKLYKITIQLELTSNY